MIRAEPNRSFAELAKRAEARALDLARGQAGQRDEQRDEHRWRRAALLWPNFAKG